MVHTILFIATMVSTASDGQPHGGLTVTEELIRREVIRLGGDWETGAKPVFVVFLGDKFESRHFEMLTHLPSVRHFHAQECPIDHFALACLSQVRQLERLDINRCELESECLSLLHGNRELREIHFESVAVSDRLIHELGRLKQVTTVVFNDCDGMTNERHSTLRAARPDLVIKADSVVNHDREPGGRVDP
jgi:hypothetical protein